MLRILLMDEENLSIEELSAMFDLNTETVSALMEEKIDVNPEIAAKLGVALNSSHEVWLNMQESYTMAVQVQALHPCLFPEPEQKINTCQYVYMSV